MILKDFYNLKVNQEIYYKNEIHRINGLFIEDNCKCPEDEFIVHFFSGFGISWNSEYKNCSFEPNIKQKQWYLHEFYEATTSFDHDVYRKIKIFSNGTWEEINGKGDNIPYIVDQSIKKPDWIKEDES